MGGQSARGAEYWKCFPGWRVPDERSVMAVHGYLTEIGNLLPHFYWNILTDKTRTSLSWQNIHCTGILEGFLHMLGFLTHQPDRQ
jgi:hypothetical protein